MTILSLVIALAALGLAVWGAVLGERVRRQATELARRLEALDHDLRG